MRLITFSKSKPQQYFQIEARSFEVKNLSLIFQKIVEHLEKSCDQRAKKSGHILFSPMGIITMWYILLCRTPMTPRVLVVDVGKTRWNQRFIQTFGASTTPAACNCCLANANGKNRRRWPLLKTISRGKSASREDWGPHRKTLFVIQEFFAMVSPSFLSLGTCK